MDEGNVEVASLYCTIGPNSGRTCLGLVQIVTINHSPTGSFIVSVALFPERAKSGFEKSSNQASTSSGG